MPTVLRSCLEKLNKMTKTQKLSQHTLFQKKRGVELFAII